MFLQGSFVFVLLVWLVGWLLTFFILLWKSCNNYFKKNLHVNCACVHAKLLQSCPTLCDPIECSPPGSSVHGILQAGILEWVALPSSRGISWSWDRIHISCGSCIVGRFFTAERDSFLIWVITEYWVESFMLYSRFWSEKCSILSNLWDSSLPPPPWTVTHQNPLACWIF